MRIIFSILFSIAVLIGGSVHAAEENKGPYLSLNAGAVFPNDSDLTVLGVTLTAGFDTGFTVDGALGYRFNKNVRAEAEIGFQKSSITSLSFAGTTVTIDGGDTDVLSGMVNGYVDFTTDSIVTPYIMGGLGVASVDIDDDDSDTVGAAQIGAGLNFKIDKNVSLGLSYRFFVTQDLSFTDETTGITVNAEYSAHRVLLGATFGF